jgi:hypothetical protein
LSAVLITSTFSSSEAAYRLLSANPELPRTFIEIFTMTEFESKDALKHDSEQSSEKKVELEQVEQEVRALPAATKLSFGSRAKRHCMRWWWVHLIIFCASFLIIALCL